MPGLFGILRKTHRLSPDSIRAMTRRMAIALLTEPGLVVEDGFGQGYGAGRVSTRVCDPEPQPLLAGRHVAWFDGEVFPVAHEPGRTATAEEIPHLLEDPRRLAALDGVFSLACFDTAAGELVLATDRLGFRPLYVSETPDWFAYASQVRALLAIHDRTPAIDEVALRQFFAFDHLLGDRTWWQGIEVVSPGSLWRVSAAGRRALRYWTFDDIPHTPAPAAEVVEELARLWPRAVRERRRPGVTPLLLSGGLDSRSLLAELRRQGAAVTTFTFGERRAPDIQIARRCARLARVPNAVHVLGPATWWSERPAGIAQTDGLINAMHLHATVARRAMEVGNRACPIHTAGDSLFGGSYLAESRIPPAAEVDWQKARLEIVGRYYQPNPFFSRGEVLSASAPDVDRYLEGRNPDCFFYLHRQRRFILYGALALAPYCETTYPGLSLPLLELLLGKAAAEDRKKSRLYARFLLTEYPEYFARIPWQATGRGLAEPPSGWSRTADRLLAHVPWRSPSRWRRPFVDYGRLVRVTGLQERLRREALLVGDVLGPAIRSALATGPLDARVLLGIATLESYLRQVAGAAPLRVTG